MLTRSLFVMVLCFALSIIAQATETKKSVPQQVETDSQQDLAAIMSALKSQKALAGNRVMLDAPEIVDSGVLFNVRITSTIPATDWIALFDDKSTEPVATKFVTSTSGDVLLESRLKLFKTAKLRTVVRAGGKFYEVSKRVLVGVSGCDD